MLEDKLIDRLDTNHLLKVINELKSDKNIVGIFFIDIPLRYIDDTINKMTQQLINDDAVFLREKLREYVDMYIMHYYTNINTDKWIEKFIDLIEEELIDMSLITSIDIDTFQMLLEDIAEIINNSLNKLSSFVNVIPGIVMVEYMGLISYDSVVYSISGGTVKIICFW